MTAAAPIPAPTPIQARCLQHPDVDAIAACGRCGTFTCAACQQVATDGRSYCFRCLAAPSPLADRSTRFVANLIDSAGLTVLSVLFVVGLVVVEENELVAGFIFIAGGLAFLGFCGLQLALQIRHGQSIGKRLLSIKVVRMDGSPVSLGRIFFLRNLAPTLLSSLCNGLFGLVDALFILGEQQRCVHDHFADTKVIRVERETR